MNAVEKTKTAVEQKKPVTSIEDMIRQSAQQLGMALPEHMRPERIVRIALTTLRINPKLYECDPKSFLAALFQSAQLGLEPNVNGEAWIIPYNSKKGMMAQFQVGAYGWVKLFFNHQNSVSIQSETVHKNDNFEYDLGSCEVKHRPPAFGIDRGEVIGYYACATLTNGGRLLKVMSKEEALAYGKRFSKCWDKGQGKFMDYTPWKDHFDAMGKVSVLRQLMKLVPKSVEIQHALAMDETVKTKLDADMVTVPDETDYTEIEEQKELTNRNKVDPNNPLGLPQ